MQGRTSKVSKAKLSGRSPTRDDVLDDGESRLKFRKNDERAFSPQRSSFGAAGLDLKSFTEVEILAGSSVIVDTGLSFELHRGTYGQIASRSGLAFKSNIRAFPGIVDWDFRGPIKLLLYNLGKQNYKVKVGDKVAQLIIVKIDEPRVVEVAELGDTFRGEKGFGSSGR